MIIGTAGARGDECRSRATCVQIAVSPEKQGGGKKKASKIKVILIWNQSFKLIEMCKYSFHLYLIPYLLIYGHTQRHMGNVEKRHLRLYCSTECMLVVGNFSFLGGKKIVGCGRGCRVFIECLNVLQSRERVSFTSRSGLYGSSN